MHYITIKSFIRLLVLLGVTGLVFQAVPAAAMTDKHEDGPRLPPACSSIDVPHGNKLIFHVYARGTQVYKWTGITWEFVTPIANLYVEPKFFGQVGTHYIGPVWESASGSRVKAARVPNTGCTPDANAIPWILLKSTETSGPGIFRKVSYIQRTNTTGGLAPVEPGTVLNELREVPYTAEYYFYSAHKN